MNAPEMNHGKDTKKNDTSGGRFTLSGLMESKRPAPVGLPSHEELLKLVVEQAAPFDFVECYYKRYVAKDEKSTYVSELRLKAQEGDSEAVKHLERIEKKIAVKDYKVMAIDHFVETFQDIRFCSHNGLVYGFNGAYWQQVGDSLFSQMLGAIAGRYGVPGTTPKDADFQKKLLEQFHATAYHPTPSTIPLVNLNNGTLRIDQNGRAALGGFDWREFVRYQLPYNYDETATAPRLMAFLDEVLPEKYLQNIIFEFLGGCFAPGLKTDQVVLLLYGQGANGKSVLCEVVTALLGPLNISHVDFDKLTQSGQAGEFAAVELDGKLLNFATELDSKSVKSDPFKKLASREKIRAAYKHKDAFTLTPPPMITNCNELPSIGARDFGFYRRLMIIPFEVTIPPEMQNTNLAKELVRTELPGLLNLILKGLQRLTAKGGHYTDNPKGREQVRELWAMNDSVTAFLEDCFNNDDDTLTKYKRSRIYKLFQQYCNENGRNVMTNKAFFGQLRTKNGIIECKGGQRPFVFPHPLNEEWRQRYEPYDYNEL